MSICQLLPFGLGDGSNVNDFLAWQASTGRLTGFQAGTASSKDFNTAWRQANFAAAMIGNFTAAKSGNDVLDDGNLAAFLENFELGLAKFIQATGINVGATPPQYPADGCLWINTGSVAYKTIFDSIPPLGVAVYLVSTGWKWVAGGLRNFIAIGSQSQVITPVTDVTAILSGNSPNWGTYNAQNGKLTIDVAGDYSFSFNAQVNVAFKTVPTGNGYSAVLTMLNKNGSSLSQMEMPMANAGFEPNGDPGYIFMQNCAVVDNCAKGDVIEPVIYIFDGGDNVSTATTMSATSFRAMRLS